jgi:hypothetical protein
VRFPTFKELKTHHLMENWVVAGKHQALLAGKTKKPYGLNDLEP